MERKDSGFMSFLLGLLVGGILGLLYAPRPGKETREMIKKAVEEYTEEGKKIYQEKAQEIQEVVETSKKSAKEKLEEIKEKAEKLSETVSEKVRNLSKKEEPSDIEVLPEE
ncbi:MAG: YtxH domain-containing protein [Actinobacteria bacterium]|nr:YtxH domain-containing protein [Actinomycetota bacterium]